MRAIVILLTSVLFMTVLFRGCYYDTDPFLRDIGISDTGTPSDAGTDGGAD